MRGPLLFAGLLLAAALITGACGGDDETPAADDTTTGTGTPTATATDPDADAGATTDEGDADATAEGDVDDGASSEALAGLIEQFANTAFTATYDLETVVGAETISGEWTWYNDPTNGRARFDVTAAGASTTTITTSDEMVICTEGACFSVGSAGSSPLPDFGAELTGQVEDLQTEAAASGSVSDAGTRTIGGVEAQCFEFESTADELVGTACYSDEGVPLLMEAQAVDGDLRMEATDFEASVSDSDFEPPYPVTDFPGVGSQDS